MADNLRNLTASGNEIIFRGGIPEAAIREVVIRDASTRTEVINKIREAGRTEINGKPLEQFFVSRTSS